MNDDDVDLAARPRRRSFSAEHEAEILAEYDTRPKGSPERGAILRREGLHSSHISEWRKQAGSGTRAGLARRSKKRRSAEEIELEKLRAKNERLEAELRKTQTALEITGEAHARLEQLSESADTESRSKPCTAEEPHPRPGWRWLTQNLLATGTVAPGRTEKGSVMRGFGHERVRS